VDLEGRAGHAVLMSSLISSQSRVSAASRAVAVVGILVLLAGTGGVAFAAGLAANSVGTKQLKNNAVKTNKLKDRSVTSQKLASNAVDGGKIANGSVGPADLAIGVLPAAPFSFDQTMSTGQTIDLGTFGGLKFDLQCETVTTNVRARIVVSAASAGQKVDSLASGSSVFTSSSVLAVLDNQTDANSIQVDMETDPSTGGTVVLNGMFRGGEGPWVRGTLSAVRTTTGPPCRVAGALTLS